MLTTLTLAAAEAPTRGWGGPIALAIVVVVYVTGVTLHQTYLQSHEGPSPTEEGTPSVSVKPQVKAVSDTDDTSRDTGWWGRLTTLPDGRRVRVTGPVDEVDVDLDDEPDEDDEEEETIEDVIDRLDYRGVPYVEIVASVMSEFRVSESTAKRRIRDARAARVEQLSD